MHFIALLVFSFFGSFYIVGFELASENSALKHSSSFIYKDSLYILGGIYPNGSYNKFSLKLDLGQSFSLPPTTWEDASDLKNKSPPVLDGHQAVFDQKFKKLYLIGGKPKLEKSGFVQSNTHPLQFWIYDFNNRLWLNKTSVFEGSPSARHLHSLSILKSVIYLFGGLDYQDGVLNDFYSFDTENFIWARMHFPDVENSPTGRFGHTSVVIRSDIVIVGGKEADGLTDISTVFFVSPESHGCTKYTTSFIKNPVNRLGHTATGGLDANNRPISGVSILDPLLHQWHSFPSASLAARAFHSAVAYGQALFLLFGTAEKSSAQVIKMDTSQILTQYTPRYSREGVIDDEMPILVIVGILLLCALLGIFIFYRIRLLRTTSISAATSNPASQKALPSISNLTDNFTSLGKFATGFWNTHLSNANRFIDSSHQIETMPNIDMSLTIDELEQRPKISP